MIRNNVLNINNLYEKIFLLQLWSFMSIFDQRSTHIVPQRKAFMFLRTLSSALLIWRICFILVSQTSQNNHIITVILRYIFRNIFICQKWVLLKFISSVFYVSAILQVTTVCTNIIYGWTVLVVSMEKNWQKTPWLLN